MWRELQLREGGGGGVGEGNDELHVCGLSSDNSLLNIICKEQSRSERC